MSCGRTDGPDACFVCLWEPYVRRKRRYGNSSFFLKRESWSCAALGFSLSALQSRFASVCFSTNALHLMCYCLRTLVWLSTVGQKKNVSFFFLRIVDWPCVCVVSSTFFKETDICFSHASQTVSIFLVLFPSAWRDEMVCVCLVSQ